MLTAALDGLVERYGLEGERAVGEFVAGAVLKHSRDFNLARETVLGSGLDPRTPAYDIQQACGTGLQAVITVANKIALGQLDSGVAGGADTASDAPLGVNDRLRAAYCWPPAGPRRSRIGRGSWPGFGHGTSSPTSPATPNPAPGCRWVSTPPSRRGSGPSAGRSRTNSPPPATATSRPPTTAASSHDLVVPFKGLARDQNLRPGTSVQKLAQLKPVFGTAEPDATMTAGNSTPLTDGAATVLLASEEWAEQRGLRPLAYLTAYETGAVGYFDEDGRPGEDGLLMAPAYAVPRMLERAGLAMEDFELFEIHEAFASQVLATLAAWEKRGLAPRGAQPPQRRRFVARDGPPLRRDRRPHRRHTGQAPRRTGGGTARSARPDLRLRGGRAGGDRRTGEGLSPLPERPRAPRPSPRSVIGEEPLVSSQPVNPAVSTAAPAGTAADAGPVLVEPDEDGGRRRGTRGHGAGARAGPSRAGSLGDIPFAQRPEAPDEPVLSRKGPTAPGGTSRPPSSPPRCTPSPRG